MNRPPSSTAAVVNSLDALSLAPTYDVRQGSNFIDDQGALDIPPEILQSEEDEEQSSSEEDPETSGYDSQLEAETWKDSITRVDDEDWEIAEGDFTKSYNRLRQHINVRSGQASGTAAANVPSNVVASLPPTNRPRFAKTKQSSPLDASTAHTSKTRGSESEQLSLYSKFNSRIADIGVPYQLGYGLGGVATNRKGPSQTANMKDKSDRATNEQVLDPRTRIILFKMINRGLLEEINGCVSTGKEANVYHALTPEGQHLALKIYKTSILVFKDRDKYVAGEHRFKNGYSRHNPRKMVKMWAEKEMRNLKRLSNAGIPCPDVLEVRENVLVIGFLGNEEGWASPRLKDAELPEDNLQSLYLELVIDVRKMFHSCHLVHADLSEYNILYHKSHLFIIDVSQSVEHDHPSAFDFLRQDIKNVDEFWARRGVKTLGLRRTFGWVVADKVVETDAGEEGETDEKLRESLLKFIDASDADEQEDADGGLATPSSSTAAAQPNAKGVLSRADVKQLEENAKLTGSGTDAALEDAVFMRSYIPRNLNEVYDPERDAAKVVRGEGAELIYGHITGVVGANAKPITGEGEGGSDDDDDVEGDSEEGEEDGSGDENDDGATGLKKAPPRGHRHEDRDAKKERKKAAKDEARERRKQKMPKAEKKKRMKATSSAKH